MRLDASGGVIGRREGGEVPVVVRDLPLLDAILSEWRETIGADYVGYPQPCLPRA